MGGKKDVSLLTLFKIIPFISFFVIISKCNL